MPIYLSSFQQVGFFVDRDILCTLIWMVVTTGHYVTMFELYSILFDGVLIPTSGHEILTLMNFI